MMTQARIDEARLGNVEAFVELYQMYRSQVYGLCLRITKNRCDAQDLTQDVFIHVRQKLHGFRGESPFGTWLYKVAYNMALMFLRKRRIEEPYPELVEAQITLMPPFGYEPMRYLALRRAISSLPPGPRTVVIMHDVIGLTHSEVGRQLGIAAGTSKAHLYRAHTALRLILGGNTGSHARYHVRQPVARLAAPGL